MQRMLLTAVTAAALGAPALAQDADAPDTAVVEAGEENLISLDLVSRDELKGATVYFADGTEAGRVVDISMHEGAIHSLLVHDVDALPRESIVDRYRIVADDVIGYTDEEQRVILAINEADA